MGPIIPRLLILFALSASAFAAPQPRSGADAALPVASEMTAASVLNLGLRIRRTELDCSHFVHYLFQMSGLNFTYAPSRELYDGVADFRHVRRPRTGDLIVWRGHVGIVVDPQEHTFLSSLNSGVKVAHYDSSYWRHRGAYRFLRYMRNPIADSSIQRQAE